MQLFKRVVPVADSVVATSAWREGNMIVGTGDPTEIRHPAWAPPPQLEVSNDNKETWTEVDIASARFYQLWRYPSPLRRY